MTVSRGRLFKHTSTSMSPLSREGAFASPTQSFNHVCQATVKSFWEIVYPIRCCPPVGCNGSYARNDWCGRQGTKREVGTIASRTWLYTEVTSFVDVRLLGCRATEFIFRKPRGAQGCHSSASVVGTWRQRALDGQAGLGWAWLGQVPNDKDEFEHIVAWEFSPSTGGKA